MYLKYIITFVALNKTINHLKLKTMKKLFAVMAFVLTCQLSYSQTYDEIMTVFKIKPNVEYQELDKACWALQQRELPTPKQQT